MENNVSENRSPRKFFLLVLLLSIPFWILAAMTGDLTEVLPIKLPISALMAFCPLLAAAILVYKEQNIQGIKELLKLSFDFQKIKDKKWYIPIVVLMPTIAALSYLYLKVTGEIRPEPPIPFLSVVIFFFVYFIGAIAEEVGWSGYVTEPLQNQYGAFKASIIIGSIWAVWHIIPYSQAHQTPIWIFWQCLGTVFLRIIMVWIFNNTNKSVFAIILFHTMINISPYLFPSNGSHYDPFIFAVLLVITAILFTNHPNNMKTRIAYILLMLANSSYIKKNYGLKFYQEFKLIANEKLEEISRKIPDIGNSIFSMNYAFVTAYVPFFYAFGQFEETKDKAGELLWLINENLLRIIPVFIWRIAGRIAISKRNVKILKNIQKQGELGLMHPMDWRIEVIEHSDRSHSCYMKECGALKVLRELGEDSIFPYACRIDYLMANLMGIKFERDKTLADGDDYCNNHILGSGFTEWSPEKGFELRK